MTVTVKVNDLVLVHKGTPGRAMNTLPDVCKTPSPGGPVPMPYPKILSLSKNLANGTSSVRADGGQTIAIKGSEFSGCVGDEPGTAGGVKSSTNMKEAKWILYSFDVKFESTNACRKSDKMTMNHENSVCLAGEDDLEIQHIKDVLCEKFCEELANGWTRSSDLEQRLADDEECQDLGLQFPPDTSTTTDWQGDSIPETIPDCTLSDSSGQVIQCFDFKGPGDRWRDDQRWRQTQVAGRPPITISAEECDC